MTLRSRSLVISIPSRSLPLLSCSRAPFVARLPVHLHPSTRAAIAEILPEWTKGQLASIAAWPDRVRMHYPWSGQLHYATPVDPEHPPENCAWEGTFKAERNVINGAH